MAELLWFPFARCCRCYFKRAVANDVPPLQCASRHTLRLCDVAPSSPTRTGLLLVFATATAAELTCRVKLSGVNLGPAYSDTIAPGTKATLTVTGAAAATPSQAVMVACSETDNDVTLTSLQGELHVWVGS